MWKYDEIGYATAHDRARAVHGGKPCAFCGSTENPNVAYRHNATHRLMADRPRSAPLPYSPDPDDYIPLCAKCHTEYDKSAR